MSFGILRLGAGERFEPDASLETALVLLDGEVRFAFGGAEHVRARGSLFDEAPTVLHVARGTPSVIRALRPSELAIVQTPNGASFEPRLFDSSSLLQNEHRAKGLLDDTSYRLVRTVFDLRNRPEARLVLGEVVDFPGRWSSYPPHHHPQPEIYHYRFTAPQGYGHAELGETVIKVRHGDTVKILDGRDHPQVAAPGYGMFYIWAIRHLPGQPYTVPEFTEAHRWLNDPEAKYWKPRR
jgi:5-deoxy-glucuronate isomerase